MNSKGEVWTLEQPGGGRKLSPDVEEFAFDIGVGADGSVWVITAEARPGGAVPAWLEDPATKSWHQLAAPAAAARVAVGPDGTAYTVNSKGEVWTLHKEGGGDLLSPPNQEFASDIGVGADGTVWVITTEDRRGGNVPAWLEDASTRSWRPLAPPAAADRIAVAPDGTALTVNSFGEVWTLHQQGGGELLSPANEDFAMDIGIGASGVPWVITTEPREGGNVPAWLENAAAKTWNRLAAPAAAAAVSAT